MARNRIRHFVEKTSSTGRALYYWQPSTALRRAGWTPRRLDGPRETALAQAAQLNARLDAARTGEVALPQPLDKRTAELPGGRMIDLVDAWRASRHYPTRPATRRHYEWAIARILAWTADDAGTPGGLAVGAIGPAACNHFYEALLATGRVAAAGQIVRVLCVLLEHGVRLELLPHNPARRLGVKGTPPRGVAFPRDALRAFVAVADARGRHAIGTALIVNYWLGQRPGDIRALARNRYRDGTFWIRQQKTGSLIAVPHSPLVAARVEAEIARQAAATVTVLEAERPLIVNAETGRAYSESGFGLHYREVRDAVAAHSPRFALDYVTVDDDGNEIASVATGDLQFRDLRPTAVTELAIAGCELPRIAAISGHSLAAVHGIVDRYLVRTGALAAAATEARLAWEKTLNEKPIWTPGQ